MRSVDAGVLFPKGFSCFSVASGTGDTPYVDFAVLKSEVPASTAVVFPALKNTPDTAVCADALFDGKAQAVFYIGDGTGLCAQNGKSIVEDICDDVEQASGIFSENILPIAFGESPDAPDRKKVGAILGDLFSEKDDAEKSFNLLFNSDFDHSKRMAFEFELGGKQCRLGAIVGDLHLPLEPVVLLISTDVNVSPDVLKKLFSEVYKNTFGTLSRSDTVCDSAVIMANGLAENTEITEDGIDATLLSMVLNYVLTALKKAMAKNDAEKYYEIRVNGCKSVDKAMDAAKRIISDHHVRNSLLKRCDPTLPVLSAIADIPDIKREDVCIAIRSKGGFLELMSHGRSTRPAKGLLNLILSCEEVELFAAVGDGDAAFTVCGNEKR